MNNIIKLVRLMGKCEGDLEGSPVHPGWGDMLRGPLEQRKEPALYKRVKGGLVGTWSCLTS